MRNLISGAAIAALLITSPAMACTDWKAVAALDAAIESHDQNFRLRDGWFESSGSDIHQGVWDRDGQNIRSDRLAAIADTCGSRQ